MKLYKYTSAKCAYGYLHSGGVEVKPCDDQHGIVSFSTKPWSESKLLKPDGVVFEFDVTDNFILTCANCLRDTDRVLKIELSRCKSVDLSYLYKVGDEFKLASFTIGPDCMMRWQYVRSMLKKQGQGDASITLLKFHDDTRQMRPDVEYIPEGQGLRRLKWSPNHPHEYDVDYKEDVD